MKDFRIIEYDKLKFSVERQRFHKFTKQLTTAAKKPFFLVSPFPPFLVPDTKVQLMHLKFFLNLVTQWKNT